MLWPGFEAAKATHSMNRLFIRAWILASVQSLFLASLLWSTWQLHCITCRVVKHLGAADPPASRGPTATLCSQSRLRCCTLPAHQRRPLSQLTVHPSRAASLTPAACQNSVLCTLIPGLNLCAFGMQRHYALPVQPDTSWTAPLGSGAGCHLVSRLHWQHLEQLLRASAQRHDARVAQTEGLLELPNG